MSKELVFAKPDAIERKLVGKILSRFEEQGFNIVKARKGRISKELAQLLYPDSEAQLKGMGEKTLASMSARGEMEKVKEIFNTTEPIEIGKKLNEWNRIYATSADVIAFIFEKEGNAPKMARELIGKTDPSMAAKGTIRGDYGNDSIYQGNIEKRSCRNLVHASDEDRAEVEVGYFEKYFF
ncbi:MAG: nucleoside-diphosphate kinase [Candidatus Micrarchaeia archaeon]